MTYRAPVAEMLFTMRHVGGLDRAIAAIEGRGEDPAKPRRRAWNGSARKAAAERMKKYWTKRKSVAATANGASSQSVSPPSTDRA